MAQEGIVLGTSQAGNWCRTFGSLARRVLGQGGPALHLERLKIKGLSNL